MYSRRFRRAWTGCALLVLCWSAIARASVGAGSVLPLSPAAIGGYPQFQFSAAAGDGSFSVGRGAPGSLGLCPGAGETLNYDADNDFSWCVRSVSAGETANYKLVVQNGVWTYTDKSVQLDNVDIREFKYQVKTAAEAATAYRSTWTASCPIAAGDPLANWIAAFNQQSGSSTPLLARANIPDPDPAQPWLTQFRQISTSYNGMPIRLYVLANDKYVAVFGPTGTLAGLTHRALGAEFISFSAPASPLWRPAWILNAGSADESVKKSLSSSDATIDPLTQLPRVQVEFGMGILRFTWNSFAGDSGFSNVAVSNLWALNPYDSNDGNASGLRGMLEVIGNPDSNGWLEGEFPMLTGLGSRQLSTQTTQQASNLLWPGGNNEGSLLLSYNTAVTQKSGSLLNEMQLPFFGVLSGGAALYIAAEDAEYQPKSFYFQNYWSDSSCLNSKCSGAAFVTHYPLDGTGLAGNSLAPDYAVVIKPMCGDRWERLGKQYRAWATRQSWAFDGNARTLVNRNDLPRSVRDGLFWWNADNGPLQTWYMLDYIQNTLKPLIGPNSGGVPVGIHLYQWYTGNMDFNTPVFIQKPDTMDPTTPNLQVSVPSLLEAVQGDGSVVMPYINAGSIDISNRSDPAYIRCPPDLAHGFWDRNLDYGGYDGLVNGPVMNFGLMKAAPVAQDDVSGLEDREVLCLGNSSGVAGIQMLVDPSLPQWQGIVDHNVSQVFDMGAGAVYLDVFGRGYVPDYNPVHGHYGHGTWWLEGQAAMAANAAGAAARAETQGEISVFSSSGTRRVVGAEFFAEPLMQSVDMVMNYTTTAPLSVPLLNIVYSGYQMIAGGANHGASSDAARAAVYGRTFVWGNQLLAYGTRALCGYAAQCPPMYPVVQYVRNLASARHSPFLIDYLSYGEMAQVEDDMNSANLRSYSSGDSWCLATGSDACPAQLPVVRGMRWRSGRDASEIILLTNTDVANPVSNVRIALPQTWINGASVCEYDGSACSPAGVASYRIVVPWMDAGAIKVLKKN